jgi:hypothetical protein
MDKKIVMDTPIVQLYDKVALVSYEKNFATLDK